MEMTRRGFIGAAAMAAGGAIAETANPAPAAKDDFIWADLLHMGYNMWSDQPVPYWGPKANRQTDPERLKWVCAADHLRFDEDTWRKITAHMVEKGMNMVVIDIGEALQLQSHPELAVEGSWTIDRFRKELERLRAMGLEPIPKLNFSTCHDTWLKDYHRMVSSPTYYKVTDEIIKEVWEIFDKPRLFHLGYDEETAGNQGAYAFTVVRQGDLWWHDFLYLSGTVEKLGSRPWIWSDYCWRHPDEFVNRMPKSVLQSNWYYGTAFMEETDKHQLTRASSYELLEKAGFDQLPTGSNCYNDGNLGLTVPFCRKVIAPERLKGFMTAPWGPTYPDRLEKHIAAIDQLMAAK